MTLSGRPLLTRRDRALFAGRAAEHARVLAALQAGLNCAVVGDPGSGRTTLAQAALATLETALPAVPTVTVYAADLPDAAGLLAAISGELAVHGWPVTQQHGTAGLRPEAVDRLDALRRQLVDPDPSVAPRPPVILIEDVPVGAGRELFGGLRDELWTINARWLVTVSSVRAAELLRPPVDVFFEVVVTLAALAEPDARTLVRLRLPDAGDDVVDHIVAAGAGSPRRLVDLAREIAANPDRAGAVSAGLVARDAALGALGRPARMLATELESLGSAAASDAELLDRLGWTRARAVQVLAELEDSGLVTHSSQSTGRGRPRKVYRLLTGSEFADLVRESTASRSAHDQ